MVRFTLGVVLIAAFVTSAPLASASCIEDNSGPDTVSCTGVTLDGYSITNPDVILLTVESGAQVDAGATGNGAAIDGTAMVPINQVPGVINNDGLIVVDADDHVGIRVTEGKVFNGSDTTFGEIRIGSGITSFQGTTGIELGDFGTAENHGEILIEGSGAAGSRDNVGISATSGNLGQVAITNQSTGLIEVKGYNAIGLLSEGTQISIVNLGTIKAIGANGRAIEVRGDSGVVLNDGHLQGGIAGAQFLNNDTTQVSALRNDTNGIIDALSGNAIIAGDAALFLTNFGTINGNTVLGSGANTVTNRGAMTGTLSFGDGDNLLFNQTDTSVSNPVDGNITGDIIFGSGMDSFENAAIVTGNVDLGEGDDRLVYISFGSISGTLDGGSDSGGGDDDFLELRGSSDMGTFDFDKAVNFERAKITKSILGGGNVAWTFTGQGRFPGGIDVRGVEINGPIEIVEGNLTLNGTTVAPDDKIGGGSNALILGGLNVNTIDLDTVLNFNELRIENIDRPQGAGWNVSGTGNFAGGVYVRNMSVGGGFTMNGGDLRIDTAALVAATIQGDGSNGVLLEGLPGTASNTLELSALTNFDHFELNAPGADWAVSGSGIFAGGSTITSGSLVLDGAVSYDGDVSFLTGSFLKLAVDGAVATNTLDVTNGTLTIEPEVGLTVDFSNGAIINDPFTIITAANGITTDPLMIFDPALLEPISDNLNLNLETILAAGGTEIQLLVTRVLTYEEVANAAGSSSASTDTAIELDRLEDLRQADPSQVGPSMQQTLRLLAAEPLGSMPAAFDQMSPETYDAHSKTALTWGRILTRVFESRPLRCERFHYPPDPKIISDSPCGEAGWTPWAETLAFFGERDASSSISYDQSGGGALMGFDRRLAKGIWLTAGVGAGAMKIDVDDRGDGHIYSAEFGFALARLQDKTTLRGVVSYSHGWHDLDRDVDFANASTDGEFESNRLTLLASASYRQKIQTLVIEPVGTLEYTYINQNGFYEDGGDGVALKVSDREYSVFSTTAGVRLLTHWIKYQYAGDLLEWADGVWTPELSVRWRADWTDTDRKIRARYSDTVSGSGSFNVKGNDDTHGAEVGVHLRFQPLRSGASVSLDYDGYFSEDNSLSRFGLNFRIPF